MTFIICILLIGMIGFATYCYKQSKETQDSKVQGTSFLEYVFYLLAGIGIGLAFLSGFNFLGFGTEENIWFMAVCLGSGISNVFFAQILTWLRKIYNQKYE